MRSARPWRLYWTLCEPPAAAFSTAGMLVGAVAMPVSRQLLSPAERGRRQSRRRSTRNRASMPQRRARLGRNQAFRGTSTPKPTILASDDDRLPSSRLNHPFAAAWRCGCVPPPPSSRLRALVTVCPHHRHRRPGSASLECRQCRLAPPRRPRSRPSATPSAGGRFHARPGTERRGIPLGTVTAKRSDDRIRGGPHSPLGRTDHAQGFLRVRASLPTSSRGSWPSGLDRQRPGSFSALERGSVIPSSGWSCSRDH
jgi:hypothetical protein